MADVRTKPQFFLGPQEEWLEPKIKNICDHNGWESTLHVTIQSLMHDISQCSLIISNDTGPGHLAAAFGIPVITLFSTGDPDNVKPLAPKAAWFRDIKNIDKIYPQEVAKSCFKLLNITLV